MRTDDPRKIYRPGGKIGAGGFGTVYKAIKLETGKEYALKMTKINLKERESAIMESALIKALNSEHIIGIEDVFEHNDRVSVVLEIMEGGDFHELIDSGVGIYSEEFCKFSL